VTTITGSVLSDLILIDKVIGAGEIAISDHRSSQPTFEEMARLAAECRVGGMLGLQNAELEECWAAKQVFSTFMLEMVRGS